MCEVEWYIKQNDSWTCTVNDCLKQKAQMKGTVLLLSKWDVMECRPVPFSAVHGKYYINYVHTNAEHHTNYEGLLESKERFAIKKYLLIIGKKKNMQVLSHTFTYFST